MLSNAEIGQHMTDVDSVEKYFLYSINYSVTIFSSPFEAGRVEFRYACVLTLSISFVETAFVSQTQSSTEDLDEVDRLANHPVLRPSSSQWHRLRKSRSETGGSVDRGLAPWTGESSNQSSPMAATTSSSGFGSRLVQAALLKKRSKKPISKMKRSYTVDFAAAQAEDSPQSLPKPRYSTYIHRKVANLCRMYSVNFSLFKSNKNYI